MTHTKIALAVLGQKFVALNAAYLEDGGGTKALTDMAAIAKVATMLVEADASAHYQRFVEHVEDITDAERNGARSTRYDRVVDAMEAARRAAVSEFLEHMSTAGIPPGGDR